MDSAPRVAQRCGWSEEAALLRLLRATGPAAAAAAAAGVGGAWIGLHSWCGEGGGGAAAL